MVLKKILLKFQTFLGPFPMKKIRFGRTFETRFNWSSRNFKLCFGSLVSPCEISCSNHKTPFSKFQSNNAEDVLFSILTIKTSNDGWVYTALSSQKRPILDPWKYVCITLKSNHTPILLPIYCLLKNHCSTYIWRWFEMSSMHQFPQ